MATNGVPTDPTMLQNLLSMLADNPVTNNVVYPVSNFCLEWGPWAFWQGVGIGKAVAWDYTLEPTINAAVAHPVGAALLTTGAVAVSSSLYMAHNRGYDVTPKGLANHASNGWKQLRAKHHTAKPTHKADETQKTATSTDDSTIGERVHKEHEEKEGSPTSSRKRPGKGGSNNGSDD